LFVFFFARWSEMSFAMWFCACRAAVTALALRARVARPSRCPAFANFALAPVDAVAAVFAAPCQREVDNDERKGKHYRR
jgi:hypothetical protein